MDFGLLPPEVNSALMYAGPGSGSMLAAAAAWDGLASDLQSASVAYRSVLSDLAGAAWLGPSSVRMTLAAAPYVTWMSATAAQAEQVAAQARMAAGAYEAAFAMTIPPPVIAANRSLLRALVATNFLGQNSLAIAAAETHYMQMWAQDAAAMYGYAGQSASASALAPFNAAPNVTSGDAGQATAMTQSTAASAGSAAQTIAALEHQLLSSVPAVLQGLAQPSQSASGLSGILDALGFDSVQSFFALGNAAVPYTVAATTVNMGLGASHIAQWPAVGAAGSALGEAGPGTLMSVGPGDSGGSPVAIAVGQGGSVGRLSTPPGWTSTAPGFRSAAATLPVNGANTVREMPPDTSTLFGDVALAGMAGRAIAGTLGRERVQVTTPQRLGSPPGVPSGQIPGLVADLQKLAELHTSRVLTDREFAELKGRLIGR